MIGGISNIDTIFKNKRYFRLLCKISTIDTIYMIGYFFKILIIYIYIYIYILAPPKEKLYIPSFATVHNN
jgi:hypothetical protein